MITDSEWSSISQKAFPDASVKAPPFLWTRLLSRIEAEELRRASVWWMQWRWMSEVTIAAILLVGVGSFYLFQHSATPLEVALEGRSSQQQAIQLASAETAGPEASEALVMELDS